MAELDIRDTTITTRPISHEAFFEGIEVPRCFDPDWFEAHHHAHTEIIRRLQDVIPRYIDLTARPSAHQVPNLFYSTCFDIPLSRGRVEVTVRLVDDLLELLRGDRTWTRTGLAYEKGMQESLCDLCSKLDCKTGIAIEAVYIPLPDLRLDGPSAGFGHEGNDLIALKSLGCAVNALCRDAALTPESVYSYDKHQGIYGPIADRYPIACNIGGLQARLKHPTLERIRESEQSVSEFLMWLRDGAPQIRHVAMMLSLVIEHNEKIKYVRTECLKGNMGDKTLQGITNMRDRYFQEARSAFDSLRPPRNDRMNYLSD